jgi:hypothetical protein
VRKGLAGIPLKGRKSRPWAKPRVGKTKRSAAHASWIEAEILLALAKRLEQWNALERSTPRFAAFYAASAPKF